MLYFSCYLASYARVVIGYVIIQGVALDVPELMTNIQSLLFPDSAIFPFRFSIYRYKIFHKKKKNYDFLNISQNLEKGIFGLKYMKGKEGRRREKGIPGGERGERMIQQHRHKKKSCENDGNILRMKNIKAPEMKSEKFKFENSCQCWWHKKWIPFLLLLLIFNDDRHQAQGTRCCGCL